jgi:hypothetical protein
MACSFGFDTTSADERLSIPRHGQGTLIDPELPVATGGFGEGEQGFITAVIDGSSCDTAARQIEHQR